jgi:hypothetical protein
MSPWIKRNSLDESGSAIHGDPDAQHRSEPTERSRLLPDNNEGYLSPDDPAVCSLYPSYGIQANEKSM